jgi:ABC-2 type transport system ATP-binding protein
MTAPLQDTPLVAMQALCVRRGGKTVIDGLDLDLPRRGIIGIVGPNGAGKTTLIDVFSGRLAYSGGSVRVAGREVIDELMAVRRMISVASVPEGASLSLPGMDYLRLVGAAEGYAAPTPRQIRLAAILSMDDMLHAPISTYSHGTRKKLSLLASLGEAAAAYVYDEVFNGLDLVSMRALQEFFRDLAGEGKLVLVCSHFLPLLYGWCDGIVLIAKGAVARRWDRAALAGLDGYQAFEGEAIVHYGGAEAASAPA